MTRPDGAATTSDRLLGGRVLLTQPARGHRAGTDAMLLAGLSGARPGDHVVDLGSASGAVGLAIAAQVPDIRLALLDIDPDLVAMARGNLAANGLAERGSAQALDLFAPPAGWPEEARSLLGRADLAVTNPPFHGPGSRASRDPGRRAAHLMAGGTLAGWIGAAARFLAPKGRLALIFRADRLSECLAVLRPAFGALTVTPVQPSPEADASRVVVAGTLGARGPDRLRPALVLHGPDGRPTPEAARLHGADPGRILPGQPGHGSLDPPAGPR